MGHKRLLLNCDKCGETKSGRFFKRLTNLSGYQSTCRQCSGDSLRQKACVTCGTVKAEKLFFTQIEATEPGGKRTWSTDCRECRRKEKDSKMDPEALKLRKAMLDAGYRANAKAIKARLKAEAQTPTPVEWPWKPFKGSADVSP